MDETSKFKKTLEKKLSKLRKEKSEKAIKDKLDKKELNYEIVSLIIEIFEKSKFQWETENFKNFELKPDSFWGKNIPQNNRECIMLGITLGTMRTKVLYNLRDKELTKKEYQSIDELVWSFVWYQWEEARILYNKTAQN